MPTMSESGQTDKLIREIHNTKNIEAKTELNVVQIEATNKLKSLSILFGSDFLDSHLDTFMILQKSKERKSMGEFVEALKSKKTELMEKAKNLSLLG